MEHTASFRSAAFGGFQRQDVLDYIKKCTEEHKAQTETLRAALQDAEDRLSRQAAEMAELERRCGEAQEQAEQARRSAQEAEERCSTLEAALAHAREQLADFDQLKLDYAEIELDARSRAARLVEQAEERSAAAESESRAAADALLAQAESESATLRAEARDAAAALHTKAQEDAAALQQKSRTILNATREAFERCTMEMKASVTTALEETNQMQKLLQDVSAAFDDQLASFQTLCEEDG